MKYGIVASNASVLPVIIEVDSESLTAATQAIGSFVEAWLEPVLIIDFEENKVLRVVRGEDSFFLEDNAGKLYGPDTDFANKGVSQMGTQG